MTPTETLERLRSEILERTGVDPSGSSLRAVCYRQIWMLAAQFYKVRPLAIATHFKFRTVETVYNNMECGRRKIADDKLLDNLYKELIAEKVQERNHSILLILNSQRYQILGIKPVRENGLFLTTWQHEQLGIKVCHTDGYMSVVESLKCNCCGEDIIAIRDTFNKLNQE